MKNVSVVYFSPTGGTKKVCMSMASAMAGDIRETDLCTVHGECSFGPEDVVIVGMPVFGGRIPAFGAEKLLHCHGNGAAAVTAAVYGNRAFEDALLELNDCLEKQGFRIAAGTALLAEHSMVREVAAGRPDQGDMEDIRAFAARILEKLGRDSWKAAQVPGNRPYRDWKQMPVTPLTDDSCIACGLCAGECPTKAIPVDAPDTTDSGKCILCMRCVSLCPVRARQLPPQAARMLEQKLLPVKDIRQKNELFL